MPYQSFPYVGFGRGLNLRDKPDAVDPQECIDCLNVDFSERGAIQTRGGYASLVGSPITSLGAYRASGGTRRLIATSGSSLTAFSLSGISQGVTVNVPQWNTSTWGGTTWVQNPSAPTATSTVSDPATPFSFANYGTPSSERVYAANGTDARYFDGVGFTTPQVRTTTGSPLPAANQAFPKASALAVQATDNRLVATGFSAGPNGPGGATVNPSHVYFSDPGDPETWLANNFVQLTPGDGERVVAAVAWRELVFVFKQTKFFVFYGNSQTTDGNPIFNYRPVEGGAGAVSRLGVVSTPEGVYFVAEDGIYITTGSSATKVSEQVEPLWSGEASSYFLGGTISNPSETSLAATADRLYMAYPSFLGQRVLVYDREAQWFSLYDLPAKYLLNLDGDLYFANAILGRYDTSLATDDGNSIVARWRSGWGDFGSPDVKVLRASKGWGRGIVTASIAKDFSEGQSTSETLDFGAASEAQPQWNTSTWGGTTWVQESSRLEPEQRRKAVRGTTFSMTLTGSGKWALHRMTHQVRQVRQPGIEDSK